MDPAAPADKRAANGPYRSAAFYYDILISLIGVGLLVLLPIWQPSAEIRSDLALIVVAFAAALASLPLKLLRSEITLIQALTVGGALLLGTAPAAWLVAIGILTGYSFRHLWAVGRRQRRGWRLPFYLEIGVAVARQIIPLALATAIFRAAPLTLSDPLSVFLSQGFGLAMLFALIHSALYLIDFQMRQEPHAQSLVREVISLSLVELLPLPFVLLAIGIFPDNLIGSMITLGGIPTLLAVLMHEVGVARTDLERRLQELSTLNNVSRTMGSTLDMDDLLPVIQQQVTRLLGIDNFYVAVYDIKDRQLWYPLAVKNGARQNWPRRPLTDRLTDRVIREQRPILLARQAQQELERIGLPPSEDAPYAWLGVPLIASNQTIGCLAVFSISPDVEFDSGDLNLLTTLSGQVSAAIENALLYEQAQTRAAQLETLNRIASLLSASLDPQEVLEQVCRSVTQVGGGQRSAIFLTDPQRGEMRLAHAYGLTETFVAENQAFPVTADGRTRCLRTGRPSLTSDVARQSTSYTFLKSFQREEIRAFGDFPLITPEGQIGYLSVYFDQPHDFSPQEVELLQTFASQAALAVSNARLYARTDLALSRRAYQLEILESISRELAAAIHSDRLFDIILDYALEFTRSPWGSLSLYDPEARTLEIKAVRGYSRGETRFPESDDIIGWVIRNRQPITIGELRPENKALDFSAGAARSHLSAPLVREERVLGVLTIESPELNAFGNTDQAFVNQLATQAAIAVMNAELYNETRRRLREQATLSKISRELVGNLNLESVARHLAAGTAEYFESRITGVYIREPKTGAYRLLARASGATAGHQLLPETLPHRSGEPQIPIKSADPVVLDGSRNESARLFGVCTDCHALVQPLRIGNDSMGVLISHLAPEQSVGAPDLQLARAIAAQGALALQNALLFSDVAQGRDRLAAVLNSVDDGVLMVDAHGYLILANSAMENVTGVAFDTYVGQRFPELPAQALNAVGFSPALAEKLLDGLRQSATPQLPRASVKGAGDQPDRVLERFTTPVWGQGHRAIGWLLVIRDVSEEHQLAQARELITETLVHDLRSPVGAVSSALKILGDSLSGNDEIARQSLDIADRSTRRVMNLIESLLEVSRMEAGGIELDLTALNLSEISASVVDELGPQAREAGIIIQDRITPDGPGVYADPEKISRVVFNLVDNALKFTPEGGQITLTSKPHKDGLVCVEVSDSGPGIPVEFQEKIFDRFSQVPGLRGRRRGSGIGLTFCRLAVEAHGGRIWVEPNPEGGSVFRFTLPIAETSAAALDRNAQ